MQAQSNISDQDIVEFMQDAPELINQLFATLTTLGIEHGLDTKVAQNLAANATQKVVDAFGGEVIYIPKGLAMQMSVRDLKIYQEFNGNNHRELAHKYGLSMQAIYKIVKRTHKKELGKHQIDMWS